MKNSMKKYLLLLLCTLLCTACSSPGEVFDDDALPAAFPAAIPTMLTAELPTGDDAAALAEFALDLLRDEAMAGSSALVSPLSIASALGMVTNGAAGETLSEMERVLGLSRDRINCLMAGLLDGEDGTLHLANGVWFRDADLSLNPAFVELARRYYHAQAEAVPMDDATRLEVNRWIEQQTDGMICDMLPEGSVNADTLMLLVNALGFEAKWASVYRENEINEGSFHRADGTEVSATFMQSDEAKYLVGDGATGFIKPYANGKYAFAAILPDAGTTLDGYLAGLDGASLVALLRSAKAEPVRASMPKFAGEYAYDLSEPLIRAGMGAAFDDRRADFALMATCPQGNIYMDFVRHNSFIAVAEQGTRAGAATAVAMTYKSAKPLPANVVTLDRPFLYAIVDAESMLPVFVGTMCDPSVK